MSSGTQFAALDRRQFLKAGSSTAAGLVLGFWLPQRGGRFAKAQAGEEQHAFAPNAFVRVAPDDVVTVISKHCEAGQGIHTGLATILAEELDADWAQVRVEPAPADQTLYKNLQFGSQTTGGSNSIPNSWEQYRRAGATARAMLISAAAKKWNVPKIELLADRGIIKHELSSRQATFGELAEAAALLPVPAEVTLKNPKNFKLIGAVRLPRIDCKAKTLGTAVFASDFSLPGMLTAVIARPPRFGAVVRGFDPTAAKTVPGVTDVVQTPTGVAVVAKSFSAARRGRNLLHIDWDESNAETRGTPELISEYRALLSQPGAIARRDGDCALAFSRAARTLTADFEYPYLAHAPMEPLSAVVRLSANRCDIWTGDWDISGVQDDSVRISGLKQEQILIHSLYGGGSFGRRGGDASQAVEIAKAIGGRAPVKLLWTREEDIRVDAYRPMYLHRLTAGLDEQGNLIAWQHRIVGQSVLGDDPGFIIDGIDITSVAGASNIPYDIPNIIVDLHTTRSGIPVDQWRSVGDSHTAFSVETFLDDVAHAVGKDPYQFRLELLSKDPRNKAILQLTAPAPMGQSLFAKFPRDRQVMQLAAEKAGWGTPLAPGRGRGLAVHYSFHASLAYVAEVTVSADGSVKVDRVVCAVDCGIAINPDVIRAQVEGGVAFGLGAILYSTISLKQGRVEQSNFNDYRVLRMSSMPTVEVYIVNSEEPPSGIGEPTVPPIGPAVSNAIFAATGTRVRTLPLSRPS
ncbi:MAG: xanthine dehydrogenase family protein molybdopterin-binding subunit [Terracidiphilus sp.]|jgi:isoquinoline 1-oxidoreductase beta subunit